MELRGGMVRRASVTYAVERAGDDECQVTCTTQGEMRSLLGWTTPFIPAQGRKLIRSNLATLERLLVEAATASSPAT